MATKQQGTQVQAFLDENEHLAADAADDAAEQAREGTPRVPFETGLIIDEEQEARMVAHAISRRSQLIGELGRESSSDGGDGDEARAGGHVQTDSFMAKRETYDLVYATKVEWRKEALGGIFRESNLTAPISRRIVRQMSARAIDYFFSTDPWFAATPEGVDDEDLADKLDRYSRFKLERSLTKEELSKAIELSFVRGEAVVKTTHVSRESIYRQWAKVLVDEEGKFILDKRGDYIFEDDAWIEEKAEDGAGGTTGTGRFFLKKDGETEQPETPIYIRELVTRKIVHFRGPKPGVVFYRDFLCPLTAEAIHTADIAIHEYDAPLMALADFYQRRDMFYQRPDDSLKSLQDAVHLMEEIGGGSSEPKSERNQPRTEMGETTTAKGEQSPTTLFAECWMKYDADGDGIEEEIFLLLDVDKQKAVFYDYTANVTWDGERPFEVIRINPVDGRWYGLGAMEMFTNSQEAVDLQLNRVNFSQGASGRVTFWDPSKTLEGQNNPKLKLNHGETYTLAPNVKAEEVLSYVVLPETKGPDLFKLLEFHMQLMQLESGVVHAGDQQFAGLESAKLATGIRNIEKSGQEMFGIYLSQLEPGLQSVLDDILGITLANLDAEEVFEYLDGDTRAIDQVTREEVKNIKLNVRLLLTRYRGEQQLQSNMQASALVKEFYALPPIIQERVAPFYRQMLKALQVKDADTVIEPLPVVTPGPAGAPADASAAVAAINAKPSGQAAPNL